jgi:hypothetical protein
LGGVASGPFDLSPFLVLTLETFPVDRGGIRGIGGLGLLGRPVGGHRDPACDCSHEQEHGERAVEADPVPQPDH